MRRRALRPASPNPQPPHENFRSSGHAWANFSMPTSVTWKASKKYKRQVSTPEFAVKHNGPGKRLLIQVENTAFYPTRAQDEAPNVIPDTYKQGTRCKCHEEPAEIQCPTEPVQCHNDVRQPDCFFISLQPVSLHPEEWSMSKCFCTPACNS